MKLVSWNVNGIRACIKKGFMDYAASTDADIICLQESRAMPDQVDLALDGYEAFWNPAEKKGYSGVVALCRETPLNVSLGMNKPEHDSEGRLLTLEYPDFFLVNVYTPNAQRGLTRLEYRTESWDPDFRRYLKKLEKKKPVIFCGDLNVAHKEIDLADPKGNANNAGFTPQERAQFDQHIDSGFIDTFREFTQEGGHYSWWSNFGRAREKNHGWRIDYFCISKSLRPRLTGAYIEPHVMGSDHCPVVMVME